MKLFNQIKERVKADYVKAKVEGTGRFAPRPGYFFIKKVQSREIKDLGELPIATVNWKKKSEDYFIEELEFEIVISNLHSTIPTETKHFQYEDLNGKVIFVYDPSFIPKNFSGITKNVPDCSWNLVNEEPRFINEQNAALIAFFEGSTTLSEACEKFANNAPYDVAAAEDWEATNGFIEPIYGYEPEDQIDYGCDLGDDE